MKTKILLYITLIMTVATLLSATPLLASDSMECLHSGPTIAALQACVAHAAEMGHIDNQGITNSLLVKLTSAQSALDRGQARVAVAKLDAFIHEVETQAGKHIDVMHADHMKMHAQEVIHALNQ